MPAKAAEDDPNVYGMPLTWCLKEQNSLMVKEITMVITCKGGILFLKGHEGDFADGGNTLILII